MLAAERRKKIMMLICEQKHVTVAHMRKLFRVSEETIRRDLAKLEKSGILIRTHGGAIMNEVMDQSQTVLFEPKPHCHERNLEWIGEKCARLVQDGDVVMLDASDVSLHIAKKLKRSNQITVITNSLKVLMELHKVESIKLISTGGNLDSKTLSYIDFSSAKYLSQHYADISFVSCTGIHMEKAVSDSNESAAEMRRIMLQNASEKVLVVDRTKFDQHGLTTLTSLNSIDILITDHRLPQEWIDVLDRHHISYNDDEFTANTRLI